MMCGKNGVGCTDKEFVAGCNRFGLDNPVPTIMRRLAHYGNEESVEKIIERMAKQYNDAKFLDADKFGSVLPDKTQAKNLDGPPLKAERVDNAKDFFETQIMKRSGKKVSGVSDIRMLDKLENAKKFESPATVVLARNTTIKIKDIPKNTTLRGRVTMPEKQTNVEYGMTDNRQIVVPSFGTVGALFARHLDILSRLKRRIYLLQQAFENQQDDEKSKELIDQILKTLAKGMNFLNFDDVHSSIASVSIKQGVTTSKTSGSLVTEKFYDDPTLVKDEQKLNEEKAKQRRLNDSLELKSIEMMMPSSTTSNAGETKNSEAKKSINPIGVEN